MLKNSDHLVIIGNGITGVSCALEVRRQADCKITLISDEGEYFFSRPALMYVFMRQMQLKDTQPYEKSFWKKKKIELKRGTVTRIESSAHLLHFSDRSTISYDRLVIATGSEPNKFGWPGQNLPGVQGFYSLQDLSSLERDVADVRHAVIVGGGLIGVEVAEMLHARGIAVTFLVRERYFWSVVLPENEAVLVGRHISASGINLRFATELASIEAGHDGRVAAIKLKNGETLDCGLVVLTAGVSPNVALARTSGVEVARGVLVNRRFETSLEGVYAAGDCAEFRDAPPRRRKVEQVWYTGKEHGITVGQILCGNPVEYNPGIWFNSAKFFHLEYQVYGDVPAEVPAGVATFFWQNSAGDKCLRLNWNATGGELLGIHAIGIRLRQDVCAHWIGSKRPIHSVMDSLSEANFDPEFFARHEAAIRESFSQQVVGGVRA